MVGFGFLKRLGLENPSWLPDFGGNKKPAVRCMHEVSTAKAWAVLHSVIADPMPGSCDYCPAPCERNCTN